MTDFYIPVPMPSAGGGGNVTIASETITIGAVTTAPTKGTTTLDAVHYFVNAGVLTANYIFRQSVVGSAGSGMYLFSLPNSYAVHSNWVAPDSTEPRVTIGHGFVGNQNAAITPSSNTARAVLYSSTQFTIARQESSFTQQVSDAIFGMNTFLNFSVQIIVPIVV